MLFASRSVWLALIAASGLSLAGCGGSKSGEISGTVTFDGKLVPEGRIYFNPDFSKGNDGPQGYAEIRDGKFDTRKNGKGPHGGPTIVVIQSPSLFNEHQIAIDLPTESCARDFDVPADAAKDLPKRPAGGRRP